MRETRVILKKVEYEVKGQMIKFNEKLKIDIETGVEIYDPKLEQENDVALYNEYRRANKLLLPEEIKKIREYYSLTQRELALLLNWGEKTITRYENGSLQDSVHNEVLDLIKNPLIMKKIYDDNTKKNEILDEKKSEFEIRLMQLCNIEIHPKMPKLNINNGEIVIIAQENLDNLSKWILKNYDYVENEDMITPLKLQKLIYIFYMHVALIAEQPLINEPFEAWPHGPVVRDLYTKYKEKKYNPIEIPIENICLKNRNIENFLKEIMKYFGKYSAKMLEEITHIEEPWIECRKGLKKDEPSNRVISFEKIKEYAKKLYNDKCYDNLGVTGGDCIE